MPIRLVLGRGESPLDARRGSAVENAPAAAYAPVSDGVGIGIMQPAAAAGAFTPAASLRHLPPPAPSPSLAPALAKERSAAELRAKAAQASAQAKILEAQAIMAEATASLEELQMQESAQSRQGVQQPQLQGP